VSEYQNTRNPVRVLGSFVLKCNPNKYKLGLNPGYPKIKKIVLRFSSFFGIKSLAFNTYFLTLRCLLESKILC